MEPQYASGFGEALSTFLARGGGQKTDRRGTRFRSGPVRGMTTDQATQKAKELWMGTSDAVREKYAGVEGRLLAPSEDRRGGNQSPQVPGGGNQSPQVPGRSDAEDAQNDFTRNASVSGHTMPSIRPGMGAAPADDGNMDAEIAAMTTPAMKAEMAAQLGMGEGMATAMVGGTPGSMSIGATRALDRNTDKVKRDSLIESGSADPTEFEALDAAKAETQRKRAEKDAQVRAEAEARQVAKDREAAGLSAQRAPDAQSQSPATPQASPSPNPDRVAADTKEILNRSAERNPSRAEAEAAAAFKAGYVGKGALEAYRKDKGLAPTGDALPEEQAAAIAARYAPGMSIKRPDPNSARGMDERRAKAAIAPGVQKAIAQRTIASRPAGDAATIARHNQWAGQKQEIDARWANTPSMAEVQGKGAMAAWGIDAQTGQQLTRANLAEQPRMAASVRRPMFRR